LEELELVAGMELPYFLLNVKDGEPKTSLDEEENLQSED